MEENKEHIMNMLQEQYKNKHHHHHLYQTFIHEKGRSNDLHSHD